jgi:hypothetical protein
MEASLTVIEGKDLKAMDVTGKSDPFIVMKVPIFGENILGLNSANFRLSETMARSRKNSIKFSSSCALYREDLSHLFFSLDWNNWPKSSSCLGRNVEIKGGSSRRSVFQVVLGIFPCSSLITHPRPWCRLPDVCHVRSRCILKRFHGDCWDPYCGIQKGFRWMVPFFFSLCVFPSIWFSNSVRFFIMFYFYSLCRFPLQPKAGKKASSVSGSLHLKCVVRGGGSSSAPSSSKESSWDEANKKIATSIDSSQLLKYPLRECHFLKYLARPFQVILQQPSHSYEWRLRKATLVPSGTLPLYLK